MSADIAATASTEWDRLWQVVRDSPDDFSSWEQLIRVAEAPEGGLTQSSPPENIARLESVYDSFLAKFPLCFGYWKKYADWELAVHGAEGCEKTYERGVAAIQNSIDLWNHYIDFKIAQSSSNEDIESLMERAAANVGLDFLAHPFWDKYLNFAEKQQGDQKRVLALLDRIVLIPMHQYARYYEKWRTLRAQSGSPSEILSSQTLDNFAQEIREERGNVSQEELDQALREKMDAQTAAVYKDTQEGTNKRWVYEAEIKRSYFHVKPLDRLQLQNWNKYLDFEELLGDKARIRALYERCLVPCAQYEEFWLRYGHWLMQNNMIEEARHAYERAAFTFLPKDRPTVKILLAQILEEEGQIDDARKIYRTILEASPSHIETILNYIHFERRQDPSSYEGYLNSYTQYNQLSDTAKAFFTVEYAKYFQQTSQPDRARETYAAATTMYPANKYLWINYVNFELGFYDEAAEQRIVNVFDRALAALPKESQTSIRVQYRDYLLQRGSSIAALNRTALPITTDFSKEDTSSNTALKRPATDDPNYGYAKQARFDSPAQSYSSAGYTPTYGGDYYNQQQAQSTPQQY